MERVCFLPASGFFPFHWPLSKRVVQDVKKLHWSLLNLMSTVLKLHKFITPFHFLWYVSRVMYQTTDMQNPQILPKNTSYTSGHVTGWLCDSNLGSCPINKATELVWIYLVLASYAAQFQWYALKNY